jgi:hypothetical protein
VREAPSILAGPSDRIKRSSKIGNEARAMRAFLRPARALSHRISTRFLLLGFSVLITRFGIWLHEVDAFRNRPFLRSGAIEKASAANQRLGALKIRP